LRLKKEAKMELGGKIFEKRMEINDPKKMAKSSGSFDVI